MAEFRDQKYKAESAPQKENESSIEYSTTFRVTNAYDEPVVRSDGTLSVKKIEERDSNGLSYGLDAKKNTFDFHHKLDGNTEIHYIPKNVDKIYKTTVSYKGSVKEAYAVFKNDVKRFVIEELNRYKKSSKQLKKEIDKVHLNKNQFIFTDQIGDIYWNKLYAHSTQFGPYNYDTQLHVTQKIDMINDLVVVKTGKIVSKDLRQSSQTSVNVPSGMNVAWMSSHELLNYDSSGSYLSTGTWYQSTTGYAEAGAIGTGYYLTKHQGVTNSVASNAFSSKFYTIGANQILSSSTQYYNINNQSYFTHESDGASQEFYNVYQYKYSGQLNTGSWDGTIPSGVPFSIECWSTNPRYVGFNGEVTVKPVSSSAPTCTYESTESATIESKDYQSSVRLAVAAAKKKFYRKLNKLLQDKGVKNKTGRRKRYERLLERVAQNVFDGVGVVRNETIAKAQGLESNPLDSPVYYDGTSKMYGGSNKNSLYNYDSTTEDKINKNTTSSTGSGGSGSGGSGGGGY